MKIVLNEAGDIVGRHVDAAAIKPAHYSNRGPVLIGIVPDDQLKQDERGNDILVGSLIDTARDIAEQMTREEVASMLADLRSVYPQEERDTWAAKLAEAHAVLANEEAETIYIAALVNVTGGKPTTIAKKIVANAKAYAEKAAAAEAFRSARYTAIDKAKNVKAVFKAVEA